MLSKDEAFRLTRFSFEDLAKSASARRDEISLHTITYSPKVFLPLTHLCQDSCSYCSFAKYPKPGESLYLSLDDIRDICSRGLQNQCSEALFTLGEAPEKRYEEAKTWLQENGYNTTIDYLAEMARVAISEFGMLPHVNPGAVSDKEIRLLKEVSVSQGMMLESIAGRLGEPGGPHFGSPNKTPARRLATLEAAGRAQVPFTTGLLVGIGDTRHERIEGLLAIRDLNSTYGHIQEVILQNFLPKPGTGMANEPPCDAEEHLWTIAAARLVFGDTCHIQAPPNLITSVGDLIRAGVDDLGGISPVTIDLVNPEKPWPNLKSLSDQLLGLGKKLKARAAIYPEYISKSGFLAQHLKTLVDVATDDRGYLKSDPTRANGPKALSETAENPILDLSRIEATEQSSMGSKKPRRESNLPASKPRI